MRIKRAIDVLGAALLLVVLSPVMVAVALAVAICMGRPVIFRQLRPGLGGREFELLKFRTMTNATDSDGSSLPDRDRLTPLGRVLRATSIDELPELINVLKGDMSLVGPRPLVARYLPFYTPREQLRHTIRPGMTGWAQVCGRNRACWDERLAMDVYYVENWSLWLDFRILARTVAVVIRRDGAVIDPASQMKDLNVERLERHQMEATSADDS